MIYEILNKYSFKVQLNCIAFCNNNNHQIFILLLRRDFTRNLQVFCDPKSRLLLVSKQLVSAYICSLFILYLKSRTLLIVSLIMKYNYVGQRKLQGGAIAGIVIAPFVIVAAIVAAFYFSRRGDVKLPLLHLKKQKSTTTERNGYVDLAIFDKVNAFILEGCFNVTSLFPNCLSLIHCLFLKLRTPPSTFYFICNRCNVSEFFHCFTSPNK